MASFYKVTVYNGRIISLIQVGDGARWTHRQAKNIERVARVIAPKRTGRLAGSHVTLPTSGSNQYQKRYRISAMAPYAIYPHEGTGIYGPKRRRVSIGKPMGPIPGYVRLRRSGAPADGAWAGTRFARKGRVYLKSHKGQPAKKWLERAARIALSRSVR